jgi:electron transport complex protein RnfB
MKTKLTRRELMETAARGAAFVGLGGLTSILALKAHATYAWAVDTAKCINSKLGAVGVPVCELCATECVVSLSAVRAVNEFSKCGRCYVCPSYFKITSAVGPDGLPSEKVCPRDAIERKAIGETKCNGCGRCVLECKEPAGLGSITLEVRHNVCLDCNRCSIATACPEDAYVRQPPPAA